MQDKKQINNHFLKNSKQTAELIISKQNKK